MPPVSAKQAAARSSAMKSMPGQRAFPVPSGDAPTLRRGLPDNDLLRFAASSPAFCRTKALYLRESAKPAICL